MPEVAKDFQRNRARIEEKLRRKRILGFLEANGMLEHIRALETERDELQDAKRVLHKRLDAEEAEVERLKTALIVHGCDDFLGGVCEKHSSDPAAEICPDCGKPELPCDCGPRGGREGE